MEYTGAYKQHLDRELSRLLLELGVPANVKGFLFLKQAVIEMVKDFSLVDCITKRLYPKIAEKNATTSQKVERSIRHAIQIIWSRERFDLLNQTMGCEVAHKNQKATNGEFIALLAERFRYLHLTESVND